MRLSPDSQPWTKAGAWSGLDVVWGRDLLRHPAAPRWRHSADRARPLSAVENVAPVRRERRRLFWAGALRPGNLDCAAGAVDGSQLVDFHRFMPLVPQSASDPERVRARWPGQVGEDLVARLCFHRRGLLADSRATKSTSTIFPRVHSTIPGSARQTQAILDDYHKILVVNPALNARLKELAERTHSARIRCAITSGCRRCAVWTCGCGPRTEMLPLDSRWWEYSDDHAGLRASRHFGACLNLLFVCSCADGPDSRAASAISRHDAAVCRAAIGVPWGRLQIPSHATRSNVIRWCFCWAERGSQDGRKGR